MKSPTDKEVDEIADEEREAVKSFERGVAVSMVHYLAGLFSFGMGIGGSWRWLVFGASCWLIAGFVFLIFGMEYYCWRIQCALQEKK